MNAFNLSVCIAPSMLWAPASSTPEMEGEDTKKVRMDTCLKECRTELWWRIAHNEVSNNSKYLSESMLESGAATMSEHYIVYHHSMEYKYTA